MDYKVSILSFRVVVRGWIKEKVKSILGGGSDGDKDHVITLNLAVRSKPFVWRN